MTVIIFHTQKWQTGNPAGLLIADGKQCVISTLFLRQFLEIGQGRTWIAFAETSG